VIGFLRLPAPHSAQGPPSIRASSLSNKHREAVQMSLSNKQCSDRFGSEPAEWLVLIRQALTPNQRIRQWQRLTIDYTKP
jgi:hypothetical protein